MTTPLVNGALARAADSVPLSTEEGLRRKLVPRQIAMMAMGGAIGVGLFLGSTVTIRLAGPGVIVTYVFGADRAGWPCTR
jgi:amino acid permease